MNNELQTIEEQLEELRKRQMRLQADNFKNQITPVLEASIGKTFVYRNNHRGGEEKWDVFRKYLATIFTKYHAYSIFEECQIEGDGRAELRTHTELVRDAGPYPMLDRNWQECDRAEYDAMREATLREIADPVRLRESLSKQWG